MAATIKELLTIVGLLYCAGCGLLGIVLYLMILIRLADYYMHLEDFEEDHEI